VSQVFLDTSAILALVNPNDEHHSRARKGFESLSSRKAGLLTSSYVLVETYALLARRMGLAAVQAFRSDLAPLCEVAWVDEAVHEAALDLLIERRRKGLSLVDAASFVVMRKRRLDEVFCFDPHFEKEGFLVLLG
jgi:predicted nucleic acid-binding protein